MDVHRPLVYGERLRIRAPGDRSFTLGPHVDGGSVERWEDEEYRRCYRDILCGDWERFDAWDATHRADARCDLYSLGLGLCTVFRSFQGWLSLSSSGKGMGALMVVPMLREVCVMHANTTNAPRLCLMGCCCHDLTSAERTVHCPPHSGNAPRFKGLQEAWPALARRAGDSGSHSPRPSGGVGLPPRPLCLRFAMSRPNPRSVGPRGPLSCLRRGRTRGRPSVSHNGGWSARSERDGPSGSSNRAFGAGLI